MIQIVRAALSIALLVTVYRHAHWSVALTLLLTLVACEAMAWLAWKHAVQIVDLQQRLRVLDEKLDTIKDR